MLVNVETQATPHGAGEARRALRALEFVLPRQAYATLCLLASELVSNGPHHVGGAGGSVRLVVDRSQSGVRAEVRDLQRTTRLRGKTLAEEEQSSWAIVLLDQKADRWGILEDTAGDVWFEIDYTSANPRP